MKKPTAFHVKEQTVSSYSKFGSGVYDDPMNRQFLYGDITCKFLEQVEISPKDKVLLDIGCGTGLVCDVLSQKLISNDVEYIGIDPAAGMLDVALDKYKDMDKISFKEGSFENTGLPDKSVDRIVSTLALHWVESVEIAATEMFRVLKGGGQVDILMIAKEDGEQFKKAIVNALRKHLSFSQIMKTSNLVQRIKEKRLREAFSPFEEFFNIHIEKYTDVVYGSFEDHMKWWKARSTPVIAEVKNKEGFFHDLQEELEKTRVGSGIPFDTACFWIKIVGE